MNELPIRPEQHIIDTQGLALLNIIINPSEYIFRILGERDYGIDGLLEIVENGHATGKMISLQLKSSKGFDISYSDKVNKNVLVDQFDSALFYFDGCIPVRIKKTTCNYWLNNNLPVVLVLADIETNCLYYSFIADQIRQRYQDFNNSDKEFTSKHLQWINETGLLDMLDMSDMFDMRDIYSDDYVFSLDENGVFTHYTAQDGRIYDVLYSGFTLNDASYFPL